MKTRIIVALVFAAALLFGLTSFGATAAVAGDKGATVINQHDCFDVGGGYQQCIDQHGEYNETATPSGNVSQQGNFHTEVRILDAAGNVVWTDSWDSHYHSLIKGGVLHEAGNHYSGTWTNSAGQTCTYRGDWHIVDGKIQYDRWSNVCS